MKTYSPIRLALLIGIVPALLFTDMACDKGFSCENRNYRLYPDSAVVRLEGTSSIHRDTLIAYTGQPVFLKLYLLGQKEIATRMTKPGLGQSAIADSCPPRVMVELKSRPDSVRIFASGPYNGVPAGQDLSGQLKIHLNDGRVFPYEKSDSLFASHTLFPDNKIEDVQVVTIQLLPSSVPTEALQFYFTLYMDTNKQLTATSPWMQIR